MTQIQLCYTDSKKFNLSDAQALHLGVEVQDFAVPSVMDGDWQDRCEAWSRILSGSGLLVSAHGAYVDINPGSPDRRIAAVTMERYMQSIDAAEAIGATYLVLHSQLNPGIKDPKVKAIKRDRQVPWWHDLLSKAKSQNVTVLLENFAEDDPGDLLDLVHHIGSPRVKACLDLGHVLSNSAVPLSRWVEVLAPYLSYVHVHWNDGRFDAHEPPPDGFLAEVSAMFRANAVSPILALEYSVSDPVLEARRLLRHFP